MSKQEDITKVTLVTLLGLVILMSGLFWLKGYKLNSEEKIKVYFEDVSGLEEGSIVRWSGLRVGVVDGIVPVLKDGNRSKSKEENNHERLTKLGQDEAKKAQDLETKLILSKDQKEIEKLKKEIETLKDNALVHIQQGLAYKDQKEKERKNHVEVTLVITKKDIPFGPISIVSIVPSGLIGEQYVEIAPLINRQSTISDFKPIFITREPIRFERFLKANVESAEAFRDAIQKVNSIIREEDMDILTATVQDVKDVVNNINKLIDNASVLLTTTSEKLDQLATSSNLLSTSIVQVGENINKIIGDEQVRQDLKTTTSSINTITTEIAKLLDEKGLAKDISQIGETANQTSTELSNFIKDLRKTHEELELPRTISNLNSVSEKLDTLTGELNSVIADEKFKEDIKVTAQKARETSENLEKMSKKFNKRFLLFRLLF